MLAIPAIRELEALLIEVPEIVDLYQDADTAFVSSVEGWLRRAEDRLTRHGKPEASQVATLRSELISASRGVLSKDLSTFRRVSPKRARDAVADSVLSRSVEVMTLVLARDQSTLREAQDLARQLVALAASRGILPGQRINGDPPLSADLTSTWSLLTQDPSSHEATVHISGLIGFQQALLLIAEELTRLSNGATASL